MSLPVVPNDGFIYDLKACNGSYFLNNTGVKSSESTQPVEKPKRYMVILAGQSNCQGSSIDPMIASDKVVNPKIKQFSRGVSTTFTGTTINTYQPSYKGTIIPAMDPLQHHGIANVNSVGFGRTFCEEFLKDNPNSEIVLMPCALGGTGFTPSPGYVITWDKTVQAHKNLYSEMITDCNSVLLNDPDMTVLCVLWHQGEHDVGNWAYPTKLYKLVSDLRVDLQGGKGKNVPFICGTMLASWRAMNNATDYINNSHIWISYGLQDGITDCAVFDSITGVTQDGMAVHFTGDGLRQMGKGYYQKFKELTNKTRDILSKEINADEIIKYTEWKKLCDDHKNEPQHKTLSRGIEVVNENSSWEDVCKYLMKNEVASEV